MFEMTPKSECAHVDLASLLAEFTAPELKHLEEFCLWKFGQLWAPGREPVANFSADLAGTCGISAERLVVGEALPGAYLEYEMYPDPLLGEVSELCRQLKQTDDAVIARFFTLMSDILMAEQRARAELESLSNG